MAQVQTLPGLGQDIATISPSLTNVELSILARSNVQTTQNGLSTGACTAVTVVFARGTTEPRNVGGLAGPTFFAALTNVFGTGVVLVQGVGYQASVAGFLAGGDATGAQTINPSLGCIYNARG
ncbi:hypothetical protein B0J14DRAFT_701920 [Halenospora varia]|nr:hypothetical protein B0J14DRAFT_701920 [Halenospora varia]